MADISKITLPNGSSYNFKDSVARSGLAGKAEVSHTHTKSQITDFPTIPTKTSQLTNDSGYKTTDNNTTYSLSKSGSTITLTGSDGSKTSVTDNNTTYNDATTSTHGLMSVSDKKALDVLKTPYATCATGRATADKVATLANFTLSVGATVLVKFTDTAGTTNPTNGNLTLNVNNTGAKPIVCSSLGVRYNLSYKSAPSFYNNAIHIFTYDGIFWLCMDWNAYHDTTYGVATASKLGLVKSGTDITVDSSGNVSVNDDSHNHVISNVDGLQSALDGKAASSHTHSSYVNQNAFSNIAVGSTTVSADSATDTLTLVAGSNITITPDATNDKITIASTNTWRGIQNNLTSDSTTDSLSAAQGKVLKGLVDGKAASSHTHSDYMKYEVTSQLLTSINDMLTAGTYGVFSATPDFPTGYGAWGFLEVRKFGSICYQTITFDTGKVITRAIVAQSGYTWTEWHDPYTNIDKPYVTGTLGEQASSSNVAMSFEIFNFTPSKVICQFGSGSAFFASVITNGFALTIPAGTTTIHYIAFK